MFMMFTMFMVVWLAWGGSGARAASVRNSSPLTGKNAGKYRLVDELLRWQTSEFEPVTGDLVNQSLEWNRGVTGKSQRNEGKARKILMSAGSPARGDRDALRAIALPRQK